MNRHRQKKLPGGRNQRLADQIRKDLAEMIQRELDVGRAGLITLTDVELSADYAHAKVYFTVMGAEPDAAAAALNEKAGWLHSLLFKQLHIHTVPTLRFYHDAQVSRGMVMNDLISRANAPGVRADDVQPAAPMETADPDVRDSIAPAEPDAPDDRG
ncbi:30S ribosome-binding factor RbfA [Pigmentiphaga soli]|uniref:Ribosome-binding factor A n=1 Tax=Pigmentiphaga soli TaxID=1007095 RepID=A0ABP8GQI9_9BURK